MRGDEQGHVEFHAGMEAREEDDLRHITGELNHLSLHDIQKLVYDLQTHQLELEVQNEELRKIQFELDQSQSQYQELYEFAPVGYLTFQEDGTIVRANLRASILFEVERQKLIGRKLLSFIHQDDLLQLRLHFQKVFSLGGQDSCVVRLPGKHGEIKFLQLVSIPEDSGAPEGLPPERYAGRNTPHCNTAITDITGMKVAEQQREMLCAELNHRVKNILNIVLSIAKQTISRSTDLGQFREAFEGRLIALAQVHQLLTQKGWKSTTLLELITQALKPYHGESGPTVLFEGPKVVLSASAAQSLYLAIHELTTNAAKYGALSVQSGTVQLHWSVEREKGREWLCLQWHESGGPTVVPPAQKGFGTKLLAQAIPYELGAQVSLEYPPEGIVFRLRMPLTDGVFASL